MRPIGAFTTADGLPPRNSTRPPRRLLHQFEDVVVSSSSTQYLTQRVTVELENRSASRTPRTRGRTTELEVPAYSRSLTPAEPAEPPSWFFLTSTAVSFFAYGKSFRKKVYSQSFDYTVNALRLDNPDRARSLQGHAGYHDNTLAMAYENPVCAEIVRDFVAWLVRRKKSSSCNDISVEVYCTRGRHRSVAVAWILCDIVQAFSAKKSMCRA